MVKLRKCLCACFGQIALLFLLVSVTVVPRIFTFETADTSAHYPANSSPDVSIHVAAILLRFLARFIFAIPLILTILYGMAWWTTKNGKHSGRRWAIAASVAMVLQGIPHLVLTAYFWREASGMALDGLIALDAITLAIGVPGLIAFVPRNSMDSALKPANIPRVDGDGTSRVLDTIAWLVQIAGYLYGMSLWDRWGTDLDLLPVHGTSFWFGFLVAVLFTIVVHELGHATVGWALGMRLRSFVIGPFQVCKRDSRWTFEFVLAHALSARGGAGVVPGHANHSRWDEICMIAAGPVVNLLTGTIAMCAAFTAPGQIWQPYWYFFALLATLSFVTFAGNLVPFRPSGAYSDGARIYQLLRGGPLADLQRAFNLASSTHVTELRPRDYDMNAIRRAQVKFTSGNQALLLRLIGAEHCLDNGETEEFCRQMAEGEAIFAESAIHAPSDWVTIFVFGNALIRRDATRARQWWAHLEAQNVPTIGVNYWLARSALLWAEGDQDEAAAALAQGDAAAKNPPRCGSDEYDLYRLALVNRAIAASVVTEEFAS